MHAHKTHVCVHPLACGPPPSLSRPPDFTDIGNNAPAIPLFLATPSLLEQSGTLNPPSLHPPTLPPTPPPAPPPPTHTVQSLFVCAFKRALQQRLLHAGASATGIIHQYVATIKTMREIDPSGEKWRTGRGELEGEGEGGLQVPAQN
mgnify:CR=1 FL=1